MQPHRGKPPTRGAYQIMRENAEIFDSYHNIALGLTIFRLIISALYTAGGIKPNLATQSVWNIIVCHFSIPTLLLVISSVTKKLCIPVYSDTPERRLLYPGYDLKASEGWGKYLSEITVIIILTHMLTVVSSLFWYLLLLVPLRGLYLFWGSFLLPILVTIFTDPESEESEKTKKKAKKTGKKKFKYLRSIKHWHHFK